jgi:hypothetical protein
MDSCPAESIIHFNIAATAGYYSQLTGVLAGFSFTALIFLIGIRLDSNRNGAVQAGDALAPSYMSLVASFIGLVLSSLGYAILAGATVSAGRAASEEPVLGIGFALAGALLIYAIVLTLDGMERASSATSVERQSVARATRHALGIFVAPLAVLYVILGSADHLQARYGDKHPSNFLDWYGWALLSAQLVVSWVLYPMMVRQVRRSGGGWTEKRKSHAVYVLSMSFLSLTFASAVALGFMESQAGICSALHPAVPAVSITVVFLAMVWLTWLLVKTTPARDDDPDLDQHGTDQAASRDGDTR